MRKLQGAFFRTWIMDKHRKNSKGELNDVRDGLVQNKLGLGNLVFCYCSH